SFLAQFRLELVNPLLLVLVFLAAYLFLLEGCCAVFEALFHSSMKYVGCRFSLSLISETGSFSIRCPLKIATFSCVVVIVSFLFKPDLRRVYLNGGLLRFRLRQDSSGNLISS